MIFKSSRASALRTPSAAILPLLLTACSAEPGELSKDASEGAASVRQAASLPPRKPGALANAGFEGRPMKGAFFFAGQWRIAGATFYDGPVPGERLTPAENRCRYSAYPTDSATGLGWSENAVNRDRALNHMLQAGVNVVNMSYWGPPNTDRWAFWAPMQTSPRSNEELFDAALGKPLLIAPFIEDGDPTNDDVHTPGVIDPVQQNDCGTVGPVGRSPGFKFADDFPGTPHDPAPALVEQIVELIDRFLQNPRRPEWRKKWAQMYDREGEPRYVVSLIHVGSNQQPDTGESFDETFAKGFGWVADRVHALRGVRVGFTLDVLPEHALPRFKPTAALTGSFLAKQPAVLAIQPFTPEVHSRYPDNARRCNPGQQCDALDAGQREPGEPPDGLTDLIEWKQAFLAEWVSTTIPVILDISSGRDAHLVFPFPDEPRYGRNEVWRKAQATMLDSLGVAGAMGIWNAYTEGLVIPGACAFPWDLSSPGFPSCIDPTVPPEVINETYEWFRLLVPPGGSPAKLPAALVMANPSGGTYSDAITVSVDLTKAFGVTPLPGEVAPPLAGRAVRVVLGTQQVQPTTDANGNATVSLSIDQKPGNRIPLSASFEGDGTYLSIEAAAASVDVARETTRLEALNDVGPAGSGVRILSARLTEDDGPAIAKRTITFTLDSSEKARKCSGVTDKSGVARCKIAGSHGPGSHPLSITFAGDAYYEPVTVQQQVDR